MFRVIHSAFLLHSLLSTTVAAAITVHRQESHIQQVSTDELSRRKLLGFDLGLDSIGDELGNLGDDLFGDVNQSVEEEKDTEDTPEEAPMPLDADAEAQGRPPKLVVAHFMVGNTYPYKIDDWKRDIQLASANDLDGFALNIGKEDWFPARVDDAYAAAKALKSTFKLFISFDMTSLRCDTLADVSVLQQYIRKYASHPNQLLYTGLPFASTFSGENCKLGGDYVATWDSFKRGLGGKVYFVPSFFVDPATFKKQSVLDGAFHWNSAWPIQLRPDATQKQKHLAIANLANEDLSYINNLSGRTYMASISPWFFTHYGADTYNKNWVYRGDDWLYNRRWDQLIKMRDSVDIVEVVTWNDYGESHYIGPIAGAQPMSQAWVDGFDHQGWLSMTSYYARAFKTGILPPIDTDRVYVWARPHPKLANAPDRVPRPMWYELVEDYWFAVVFASAPSTVILSTPPSSSPNQDINYDQSTMIDVPAGVSKLRSPLKPNGTMRVQIERGGVVVVDYVAQGFNFNPNPSVYNFNAWVGNS